MHSVPACCFIDNFRTSRLIGAMPPTGCGSGCASFWVACSDAACAPFGLSMHTFAEHVPRRHQVRPALELLSCWLV
eukprot:13867228-Alexandrium_andersonii.AAC.1